MHISTQLLNNANSPKNPLNRRKSEEESSKYIGKFFGKADKNSTKKVNNHSNENFSNQEELKLNIKSIAQKFLKGWLEI